MLSKDILAGFDPAVKSVRTVKGQINILLHFNTSVLTLTEQELILLLEELRKNKNES